MRIGATLSPALMSLLERKLIDVDYIEVNGELEMEVLEAALALRPVLLHDISYRFWLNYEDPFDAATMAKARAMIDLAQPPWHSTGIGASAEPQQHTTEYWRGAPVDALQPRARCLANIVRNAGQLKAWLGIPLLLENYNYHPTNAYEYVCEPATFSQLIEEIDCGMLLDLAHAQISTFNMGWPDAHTYLGELPLARVREIHINHPYNDGGKQMLDRHLPIGEADIALLEWTLARTPQVEAVTLESHLPDESALRSEVDLLRSLIAG
ncbi:MAG: DUF692 family protein [Caldilineaceae bacterium]